MLPKNTNIDWSHFEKSIHDRFGVNAVTVKNNGVRKTSEDMRWANDLCALIKTNPNGARRICDRILKYLLNETKERRTFINTDRININYIGKTVDVEAEKIRQLLPSLRPIAPRTVKELKCFITSYVD